jgi:hemoglobin/transferrin/lactoferrin receptor protein
MGILHDLKRITALWVFASATAQAAAPEDEAPLELDRIETVAVATRLDRPRDEVVGLVEVVDAAELAKRNARDAADVVRYLPGVSVEGAGTRFGSQGFTVRGVGGDRVTVEIDGVPQNDHFAVGAFANATAGFIDPDLIQRIELLRGPASTLYGSDALGGVVAIRTRSPNDLLGRDGGPAGSLRATHASADASLTYSGLIAAGGERFGVLLGATSGAGEELDHAAPASVRNDPQTWDRDDALAKLAWNLPDAASLELTLRRARGTTDTDIRSLLGRGRFATTTELTGDDAQARDQTALRWVFGARGLFTRGVLGVWTQDTDFDQRTVQLRGLANPVTREERRFRFSQATTGLALDLEGYGDALGVSHRLGMGLEATRTATRERRDGINHNLTTGTSSATILGETFPVRDFPNSDTDELGVYLVDEFDVATDVTVIPGLRLDYYHLAPTPDAIYRADNPGTTPTAITDHALSPKLGVEWDAAEGLDLYAQYARGFRAPPFEDVNIGLDIPLFGYRAIPNPALRAETSDGFEVGLRFNTPRTRIEVALFLTDYQDLIESRVNLGLDPVLNLTLFQSQNRRHARIHGVEASARHRFDALTLHSALAYTEGEDRDTGAPLNGIDPPELVLGVEFGPGRWTVEALATLVAAKDEVEDPGTTVLFRTPGYASYDLYANWSPWDALTLTLGIRNLTDHRHWRWSAVQGFAANDPVVDLLSDPGRNLSLGIRWVF